MALHYFFFFFFFTCLCFCNTYLCCPQEHKEALLQFKSLFIVPNKSFLLSSDLDSWVSDSSCCRWKRVSCSTLMHSRPVEVLDLSGITNYSTAAALTPLFQIRSLTKLDMSSNGMYGQIPKEFFEFEHLRTLYLRRNKLNLSLSGIPKINPPKFSNQKHLDELDLSENELEGTIPQWLLDLGISNIVLSNNKLTGSLPPRLFHSNLNWLDLSNNRFTGQLPENIGDASNLAILLLSQNQFTGSLPISISRLVSLVVVDLSNNDFSGETIPYSKGLWYMDLSYNKFSGELPSNMGFLGILKLGHNRFSGSLPQGWTAMYPLAHIELQNNKISGEVPKFLAQISGLKVLILRDNCLQGSIPHVLSNLASLQILDLSGNNLTGNIPHTFGNLSGMIDPPKTPDGNLLVITVSGQTATSSDTSVNWKSMIQNLSSKSLNIYSLLDLSRNHLSGEIPPSLGGLKGLKSLNISYNKFFGSIPLSFGGFENLESLDLSHNQLYGMIPQTFKNLKMLTMLDLSNNKLEGPIPEGPQMDRMNNPNYYANNTGLCGTQINVSCHSTTESPNYKEEGEEEPWFLWEGAWVGCLVGFFWTVIVFHLIKFLNKRPRRHQRRNG